MTTHKHTNPIRVSLFTLLAGAYLAAAGSSAYSAIINVNVDDSDTVPTEAEEATTYVFTNLRTGDGSVPSNTSADLANGITPVIINGTQHGSSDPISVLTDGSGGSTNVSTGKFFYTNSASDHMFRISLGAIRDIGQINTFSWHGGTDTDSRAHQEFNLWASDGTAGGFLINDPTSPGWTQLATLAETDTRTLIGDTNGQVGVSINPDSGLSLGSFQHFIFEVSRTNPADSSHHTFYSEIDIIAAAVIPEPSTFTLLAAGIGMLAFRRRRRCA